MHFKGVIIVFRFTFQNKVAQAHIRANDMIFLLKIITLLVIHCLFMQYELKPLKFFILHDNKQGVTNYHSVDMIFRRKSSNYSGETLEK